jgi:hypothetical protein
MRARESGQKRGVAGSETRLGTGHGFVP